MMELYIKNMVCGRCIMAVENVLKEMNVQVYNIQLGRVQLNEKLNKNQLQRLDEKLEQLGFERLDDKGFQEINRIKSIVIDQIHHKNEKNLQFSEIISKKMNKDYSQLSKLFSSTEGITIEQYIILQKIERVKELITYNELNLKEIAYRLGYSSPAHLSSQFKKIIGMTPSEFKKQSQTHRKSLDKI